MKILVINCGSSSLRFKLFQTGKENKAIALGHIDGIGLKSCKFTFKTENKNIGQKFKVPNHDEAVNLALNTLKKCEVISKYQDINAIGHRVVHGGEEFSQPVKIDAKVLKKLEELSNIAPLHNPANIAGIKAIKKTLKRTPQVAVFDTAFHQTMPQKAYLYGLPFELYEKNKIRRYGFHGTSHKYVTNQAIKILKKKKLKIITCHIGNGTSITASFDGKSIDTSMGFTPLEGVMMGTRCGSIDPAIPFYLERELKMKSEKIETMLNKESGLKGFSKISSDMRPLYEEYKAKNPQAILTLETLCYQMAKYCGAYTASLNGLDALVFTGGIGENAYYIRKMICQYLEFLNLKIDSKKNKANEETISIGSSKVKVLIIPTNEEKQIALETKKTL